MHVGDGRETNRDARRRGRDGKRANLPGKQLSDDKRAILAKLFQIAKLTNREIVWVLDVDAGTVHRDALLDDMGLLLGKHCGLVVSIHTISRQLKKADGKHMRNGGCARVSAILPYAGSHIESAS